MSSKIISQLPNPLNEYKVIKEMKKRNIDEWHIHKFSEAYKNSNIEDCVDKDERFQVFISILDEVANEMHDYDMGLLCQEYKKNYKE